MLLTVVYGFLWWLAAETVLLHVSVAGHINLNDYMFLTAVFVITSILGLTRVLVRVPMALTTQKLNWLYQASLFVLALAPFIIGRFNLLPWYAIAAGLGIAGPLIVSSVIRSDIESPMAWHDVLALLMIGLIAAFFTYVSHRPDADDGGFLDIVLSHLQYPHLPLFGFDASHGDIFPRFRFLPYAATSYEVLVAVIAHITGASPIDIYYGIVPPISAFLCVLACWALLREIVPKSAVLGTAICVVLVFAWGETHIAYGNRLFVRFFQGKGLLIGIAVPLCVLTAVRFMRMPTLSGWVLLCASQIMALGLSSSGLIVGPLAAAVGVLTALIAGYGRNLRTCLAAGGAGSYLFVVAAVIAVVAPRGVGELGTILPVTASLGEWPRMLIAVAIGTVALGLWWRGVAALPAALAIACVILPFNPFVSMFFQAFVSQNMRWRVAWAAPVPLLLAATLAVAISVAFRANRTGMDRGFAALSMLLLCAFLSAGRWTLVSSNDNSLNFAMWKQPPAYDEAHAVTVALLHDHDIVLAPDPIATWLPAQAGARLRLVMAGHTYPLLMPLILAREDFDRRYTLFNMVTGRIAWNSEVFVHYLNLLDVGIVVLDGRIFGSNAMAEALSRCDCKPTPLAISSPITLWRCRKADRASRSAS